MTDGKAVLIGGPEDGGTVFIGHGSRGPRKIDFVSESGNRVARYIRATRFQFDPWRSGGCAAIGQPAYRFKGYVEVAGAETL